jgi:hypothetical protein
MRNPLPITTVLGVLACAAATAVAAMDKDEYRGANARIDAEYQVDRQKCGERHGNAADLCVARAHGARDVSRAELEATYKPGPRANYNAAMARAQSTYAIAKLECNDRQGAARKGCVKDAEAARARAKAEAEALRAGR